MTYDDRAEQIRHTRETEMFRIEAGRVGALPENFSSKVVGVSFVDGFPRNLWDLEAMTMSHYMLGEEPLAVVLRRNPGNQYDANAIEVHVPGLGDRAMVGHLPRPVAARLAPLLDAGELWQAEVGAVRLHPDHIDNPGLSVRIWRIS